MKKTNIIKTILLSSLTILATSCGENEMEEMMPDITPQTYSLIFDAVKPSFEFEEEGGSTRASGSSWTNNDEIFLFVNSNAAGHAKYSNGSWKFTAYPNKSFANTTDSDCKVYYFENSTKGMYGSDISIDENTPLYHANAKYSVKNGTITVKAKLTPKAFRFRFKNETGSDVSFSLDSDSKINYYKSWSYASGKFDYAPKTISGTAVSNTYSDYYYGTYKDSPSSISLTLTIGNTQYTRKFSTSQLVADTGSKNSGCFKLPASDSNLNGWTKKGPNFNGHEYVDLGLKDEQGRTIYWATCNLGANQPEEYGDYYAWGETQIKNIYSSDSYSSGWYNREEISTWLYRLKLSADAANYYWGDQWRMPTRKEVEDLMDKNKCSWVWYREGNTEFGGNPGYKVSNINDNSKYIFLPCPGEMVDSTLKDKNIYANYWTCDYCGYGHDSGAYYLFFAKNTRTGDGAGCQIAIAGTDKIYLGQSIRPVYGPRN